MQRRCRARRFHRAVASHIARHPEIAGYAIGVICDAAIAMGKKANRSVTSAAAPLTRIDPVPSHPCRSLGHAGLRCGGQHWQNRDEWPVSHATPKAPLGGELLA